MVPERNEVKFVLFVISTQSNVGPMNDKLYEQVEKLSPHVLAKLPWNGGIYELERSRLLRMKSAGSKLSATVEML